jgi:hypothetical protein
MSQRNRTRFPPTTINTNVVDVSAATAKRISCRSIIGRLRKHTPPSATRRLSTLGGDGLVSLSQSIVLSGHVRSAALDEEPRKEPDDHPFQDLLAGPEVPDSSQICAEG